MNAKLSYLHQLGKEPLKSLTMGALLEKAVEQYGETVAIISRHQNKTITFTQLLKECDEFAAGLSNLGLEKGDRLGMWGPNSIEWIITMLACARLGLVLVALNPFYQALEMEYCIQEAGIKAVVCARKHKEQDYYELLNKIAPELPNCVPGKLDSPKVGCLKIIIVITDENLQGAYKYSEVFNFADPTKIETIKAQQNLIQADEVCNIQFTSGTTGQPKAALLTHFGLTNNSYEMGRDNELNVKHHKLCLQVPLFHVFGLNAAALSAFHFGTTLVMPSESYSAERSLEAISEEACSCIFGTPTMYIDLVNQQRRRKLRINPEIAVIGAAPSSQQLLRDIQEVLKVKVLKSLYGLTEVTGACFQSLPGEDANKIFTTVGCLKQHLEAKVVDENGNLVPMGEVGELCIRGYSRFMGYWGDDAKTKNIVGNDGWFKTGDQFVLMEDGYGMVKGRFKEIINRGGEKIFPKEIEDILNTHPDILETHVIGLPHARLGEEVCACIRVKNNANVTLETVVEFCRGKLARFKIPSQVKVMQEFPKTASGKVQKRELVERFAIKK